MLLKDTHRGIQPQTIQSLTVRSVTLQLQILTQKHRRLTYRDIYLSHTSNLFTIGS